MFGFRVLTVDIIFHPDTAPEKRLKKREYSKKDTMIYYKKKYIRLFVCIQSAHVCKRWIWPSGEVESHWNTRWQLL